MTTRLLIARFALSLFALTAPARAADEPQPSPEADAPLAANASAADREARLDRLFDKLATATSPEDAKRYEASIDEIWSHSGSDTADLLTLRAVDLVASEDRAGALNLLEAALQAKPDYAEGWNKRATLFFLRGDYPSAMTAIRETLRHEPRHYGAWAGLGRILQQTGDDRRALDAYRHALAINPQLDGLKGEVDELVKKLRGEDL